MVETAHFNVIEIVPIANQSCHQCLFFFFQNQKKLIKSLNTGRFIFFDNQI